MSGKLGDRSESRMLVARLAVEQKMVDESTVARVFDLMDAAKSEVPFGDLLLQLGHITRDQLQKLTALHRCRGSQRLKVRFR